MIFARTHADLHNIRKSVERIQRVSDRVVGVGPVGIGLDGVLAAIPGAGVVYSFAAAGFLLFEGVRARASAGALMQMAAVLALDTLIDAPAGPIAAVVDTFFTGHKWAARTLVKHMDETIYIEGSPEEAAGRPEHAELMERVRTGQERRRIVFLR